MRYKKNLNVTLPPEIIGRIEKESKEKDITKSRYVMRLLEQALQKKEVNE